jgi:hypothetical protein
MPGDFKGTVFRKNRMGGRGVKYWPRMNSLQIIFVDYYVYGEHAYRLCDSTTRRRPNALSPTA